MGSTIAEKIIARAMGRATVVPDEEVMVKPDFVLAYELRGYSDVIFRDMKEMGVARLADPERFALFIDHRVPSKTPQDEALHNETRRWCAEQGVALYERQGIGHQVAAEAGYAPPGGLVVHFDGHISQLGAFGTLAFGLRSAILEAFVRETVTLTVPETVRLNLYGQLSPGVMARDIFHSLIAKYGPTSCLDKVLEIDGPGAAGLTLEALQTITGLAMFVGALTAIVAPTKEALAFAAAHRRVDVPPAYSDPDAVYSDTLELDLSALEPMLIAPPNASKAIKLSECIGLPIQSAYLGSCVSGRIEDLRVVAGILAGRSVAPGLSLHVVPTSAQIMSEAAKEGLLAPMIDAGAFLSSPSCDYCSGNIATMSAGQRAVSTGTLNVPGRMGHEDSEIYLCNAAVLAASAIEGQIADPRPYLAR